VCGTVTAATTAELQKSSPTWQPMSTPRDRTHAALRQGRRDCRADAETVREAWAEAPLDARVSQTSRGLGAQAHRRRARVTAQPQAPIQEGRQKNAPGAQQGVSGLLQRCCQRVLQAPTTQQLQAEARVLRHGTEISSEMATKFYSRARLRVSHMAGCGAASNDADGHRSRRVGPGGRRGARAPLGAKMNSFIEGSNVPKSCKVCPCSRVVKATRNRPQLGPELLSS
jgi:hypothetical protein